MTIILVHVV